MGHNIDSFLTTCRNLIYKIGLKSHFYSFAPPLPFPQGKVGTPLLPTAEPRRALIAPIHFNGTETTHGGS